MFSLPALAEEGSLLTKRGRGWKAGGLRDRTRNKVTLTSSAAAAITLETPDFSGQIQTTCEEKTASFTAAVHGSYVATASLTVTDPTPEAGHGFDVFVRSGTATVGGTGYSTAGNLVRRVYHSGAWATYVMPCLSGAHTWNATQSMTASEALYLGSGSPTAGTGLLQFSSGTTKANGIAFGTDTFLYRVASNALATPGVLYVGEAAGSSDITIEIGRNRTADGNAYIDLIATTGGTDYNARLIRFSGTNGVTRFGHTGTGELQFMTEGAAPFVVLTNSTERFRAKPDGQCRFYPLAADPAGAEDGDVYYNSTTNKLRVRAAGAWVDLH